MPSARFGAAQADCWMRFLVGVIIVIVASRQVIVRLAVGSPDTTDLIYKHVILLPNYFEHGFVRRGLDGTIYALISDRHFFESLYVFHVFAAVWLALPVTLLLRELTRLGTSTWAWFAFVLIISPQLLLLWSTDIGRGDMLISGLLVWSTLIALKARYSWATAPLLIGTLAHEAALIYGTPLVFVIWLLDYRVGRASVGSIVRAAGLLGLVLLIIATGYLINGDKAQEIIQSVHANAPHSFFTDLALYATLGGARLIPASACMSFSRNVAALILLSCLVVLLLYSFVLIARTQISQIALAIASLLPMVAIWIVAADYGRWLSFAVMNAWIVAVVLRLKRIEPIETSSRDYIWSSTILMLLLLMRPGNYDEAVGLTPNIARLIWAQPVFSLSKFLPACDPEWRSVIDR